MDAITMDACEDRFRLFVEAFPLPLALVDAAGKILYLNAQFKATFGYTGADLPTLDIWFQRAYHDPASRQQAWAYWETARAPHADIAITQLEITCKDGTPRTTLFRVCTASATDQWALVYEDVTATLLTEYARRESEARLQAILDNTSAIIYLKDLNGRYQLINRQYETRHNIRLSELRGKTDYDLHPQNIAAQLHSN